MSTLTVWTLTIDHDMDLTTEVHPSEQEAIQSLLTNHAQDEHESGEVTAETVLEYLTERAGYVIYLEAHEISLGKPQT